MRLRELREESSLSMRELAALAGITHQTVYRIEHGQQSVQPRTLRKLADVLGVAPKELWR
jgi:transcriptional regulator with XRE-family HTH domain